MTFEDDKLTDALKSLQETEKKCETSDGFVKSIKRKFSNKRKPEVSILTLWTMTRNNSQACPTSIIFSVATSFRDWDFWSSITVFMIF